jgi:acetoin:2,6-dichlorophenolindophenol oxidoreductase subunit beta
MSVGTVARDHNVSRIIADTLRHEMRQDPSTVLLGEDVGYSGGTFGASRGAFREFGAERVRDTPISEMAFTGMAVGLAMSGYRPLVEIMFVDFVGVCLEQLYNAAAKNYYMSGGQFAMPMTVRAAGGSIGVAAQHSQCLWGMLAHLPGLQVVAPSNPYDYRGLLSSAVRSDDTVVVIEHKDAYLRKASTFALGASVPDPGYVVPLGKANVVRVGDDVTVVAASLMVERAIEAADALAAAGISAEVVDLRTISPLDHATVCESIAKTGVLVVVDEDYRSFGLTGELAARALEELGPRGLRAFARLAEPDVPLPASEALETELIPTAQRIAAVVTDTLKNAEDA